MNVYDLIAKKRDGQKLNFEEIKFLVHGYVEENVPDYQMAAFLMAVYFQGMDQKETADLTKVMIESGETVDLSLIRGLKVDKHSTGGVGDKVSLVLAPIVAAGGITMAKMSGRGLGHTGGTIDKLEAIPGLETTLSREEFIEQVNQINLAVIGQTGNLVPADKKIYALRDVTATVSSIPLIASSIMSKKLAAGADRIVLDVKVGNGAFTEDLNQAEQLAQIMVDIGNNFGKKTIALITDMNQPLGEAIGNSLEVIEALDTLKGKGPLDLTQISLELASHLFYLSGKVVNNQEGYHLAAEILASGKALAKFKQFVAAQKGDINVLDDYSLLPQAKYRGNIRTSSAGYLESMNTNLLGRLAMELGAGRQRKEDPINYGVGIVLKKKIGDYLEEGDELATIHYDSLDDLSKIKARFLQAFHFSKDQIVRPPLIYKTID